MLLSARNTDLGELARILQNQHASKWDAVVSAPGIWATPDGLIHVQLPEPEISEDGVTFTKDFKPTDLAVSQIAEKLSLSTKDLRKTHAQRPDIFADIVNGWLHGHAEFGEAKYPADKRSFFFRAFESDEGGIMRGLLSDNYLPIDNVDVLMTVLKAIEDAGVAIDVAGCDLSEKKMRVRLTVPEIKVMAPVLFENYRSPFDGNGAEERAGNSGWTLERARQAAAREGQGYEPGKEPIFFGGVEFGNSELGGGAFFLTPCAEAEACRNKLRITIDAERKIHLGETLEPGVVKWSNETRERQLALIRSKTMDSIKTFTSADYWQAKVAELEAKAGKPVAEPEKVVKVVSKALKFTEAEQNDILRHFIKNGQGTAGGLFNAVTSASQLVADPDRAADIEAAAVKVLDLV